ncbi:hypothetical protein HYH02_015370 [Chlamydomonas schloesseri]|uniref:Uncharacterized protein n=1 Tax=Chlamydomonas schloesseri TaxID=2026947 RepID=A0A835SCM9_9CHLO|nr:hypothetical protein HYH02_015370 [Chlamydomonas schloesseri]|eukprot:KAG2423076.1 hypothetical protein HYH02_015370 [Chlamydomonas schloesseri]
MGNVGRGRGASGATTGRGPDLNTIAISLTAALKAYGATDVQVTTHPGDMERPPTLLARGRDRTLALAVLQLVAARPGNLFPQNQPLHRATLDFRALPNFAVREGDAQVLATVRGVEGPEEAYQTINTLRHAGAATLRKLLGKTQTYQELRDRVHKYVGSAIWGILSCSARAYGKGAAEEHNLRQAYCPDLLRRNVVALSYTNPFQASIAQNARHLLMGVRGEAVALISMLPFPAPAAELQTATEYAVLLRNEGLCSQARLSELPAVIDNLQKQAAEQDRACRKFTKEVCENPDLLGSYTGDDTTAGNVQLRRCRDEDDLGFTPASSRRPARSTSAAAGAGPGPSADPPPYISPAIQRALERAKAQQPGGRRAYIVDSSRNHLQQLLGAGADSPEQLAASLHWSAHRTGQLVAVHQYHVRITAPGDLVFQAPEGNATLALLCPTSHDAGSVCAAGWCDNTLNPAQLTLKLPTSLSLTDDDGEKRITMVGIMHPSLGGRYMHTGAHAPTTDRNAPSVVTSHAQQHQHQRTTSVIARNLLAGEPFLAGLEQATELKEYRARIQKQTGLLLQHPPPAQQLQPSNQLGSPAFRARQRDTNEDEPLTLSDSDDDQVPQASSGNQHQNSAARSLSDQLAQEAATADVSNQVNRMQSAITDAGHRLEYASLALELMSNAVTAKDANSFQSAATKAASALTAADSILAAARVAYNAALAAPATAAAAPHHARAKQLAERGTQLEQQLSNLRQAYNAATQHSPDPAATRQHKLDDLERTLLELRRTQHKERAEQQAQQLAQLARQQALLAEQPAPDAPMGEEANT